MGPRWRKVIADLVGNRTRTAMVVLSITVGAFAVGAIVSAYLLLLEDMDAQYQAVVPYSASVAAEPFDDSVLDTIRHIPGVREAEGRSFLGGRAQTTAGAWVNLQLISIPPLAEMRLNRLRPVAVAPGTIGDQEVYLEKSLAGVLPTAIGSSLLIETLDRKQKHLRVAGTVEDLTLPPYTLAQIAWGYVSYGTMADLAGESGHNSVYFTVAENPKQEDHVRAIARQVVDRLERSGHRSYGALVFRPGEHWGASIVSSMLTLLGALGFLAVLLSGFLVTNTVSALISQQIRQIGVMKAIGARSSQVIALYLGLIVCYSALAILIAVPTAGYVGYVFARGFAAFFGFDLAQFRMPSEAVALQMAVALVVPLGAGIVPVVGGTRVSVRQALSDYGLGNGLRGPGLIDRILAHFRGLSRPVRLSIRNAFLKQSRMALTLITLSLAGAIFTSVLNVRTSFGAVADEVIGSLLANVNLSLTRSHRIDEVTRILATVPDVAKVEGWIDASGQLLTPDQLSATDIVITALPGGSTLIRPALLEGRWLAPDDEQALVASNLLVRGRPDVRVGSTVTVKLGGREQDFVVVGVVKLAGNFPAPPIYANYGPIARMTGQVGRAQQFRIQTSAQDQATETAVTTSTTAALLKEGIRVADSTTGTAVRAANTQSFDVVITFLLIMSALIAAVGGLGLMGTMSINVMERTRELGVMRAIGASTGAIVRIVVAEGVLIGVLSWGLGSLLAFPISALMCAAVGVSFVGAPMALTPSWAGFTIWLVLVTLIAALASILPSVNASRLTVREALAYE